MPIRPNPPNNSRLTGNWVQPAAEHDPKVDTSEKEPYEGGEWVFAPIPISDPSIKYGLAGVIGRIYRMKKDDDISPPTLTGIGGLYTTNKTWGIAGMHQMSFGRDRYRSNIITGFGNINIDFSGKGLDPGQEETQLPIGNKGFFFQSDFMIRAFERVYIGPRFTIGSTKTGLRSGSDEDIPPDFPDLTLDVKTVSMGFGVIRDTRDSSFYSRSGSLGSFTLDIFNEGIGSDFDYQRMLASYNVYYSLARRHVLAGRISACSASKDTPFWDLCYLGQAQDLRGYRMGRFQDLSFLALQAEYRVEVFWRIGLVGFVGVGQVAENFGKLTRGNWLPSGGFGLRFLVAEKNHVNFSIDIAWGRDSRAAYISGGEVF